MAKTKNRKKRSSGGGDAGATTVWDSADHAVRQEHQANKKARKLEGKAAATTVEIKQDRRSRLTAKLTRGSREKREASKLRLNITKTQREIEKLRQRLKQWDNVHEAKLLEEEEAKKRADAAAEPKKKRGRLGPESWKLKGPARPAWLVNEFDVRYVCPHQKAHDDHNEKTKRIRNLVVIYKGSFGQQHKDDHDSQSSYLHRRQFLALLMQFGLLNMEANKYKTARLAFLECLDLDGVHQPITDARCHLMRLYLQANRPQSVQQLWTCRLAPVAKEERSVWVLYSVALVAYLRWHEFREITRHDAETALIRAFRGNVLCAYYLAFSKFFHEHMEYTDEIEHASDDKPLEEAIEYCSSEQMGMWLGSEGALEWVQATLLRILQGQTLFVGDDITKADLDWKDKLQAIEREHKALKDRAHDQDDGDQSDGDNSDSDDSEDEEEVDVLMFANMYRTTMEMLEANGSLLQVPPTIADEDDTKESESQKESLVSDETDKEPGLEKNRQQYDDDDDDNSHSSDEGSD
jgi:hypothetical protein